MKILVVRNDKLGDFTLSLPTFELLKQCFPTASVHAIVPEYTQPIAQACPYIDQIVIDPGKTASRHSQKHLFDTLKKENYSAALTLYSTTRIGFLLARLRIPVRIAPATKLAQIFYNQRVRQRRSQSLKPEYQYNIDLARHLLAVLGSKCDFIPQPPYLRFSSNEINQLKQVFCDSNGIAPDKQILFVHPGSGGSANNLNPSQYAQLADNLAGCPNYHVVLTAGPGEYDIARKISAHLNQPDHCVYESRQGLAEFSKHIAFADLFISGSTGPLHIAGALNRPTVGFYTNRRSATSLRWQTLSTEDRRLAFSPPPTAEPEDMGKVDLDSALIEIRKMLARLYPLSAGTNP